MLRDCRKRRPSAVSYDQSTCRPAMAFRLLLIRIADVGRSSARMGTRNGSGKGGAPLTGLVTRCLMPASSGSYCGDVGGTRTRPWPGRSSHTKSIAAMVAQLVGDDPLRRG